MATREIVLIGISEIDDVSLRQQLSGNGFDAEALISRKCEAFAGDPAHTCMGRSAPERLARALDHADRFKLDLSVLRDIADRIEEVV